MPNPLRDAPLYDFILLAGQQSPGRAKVAGASSPRNWDERKGYGLSGATIVYAGDGLAKFSVELFFWEEHHFDQWDLFAELLAKPPEGQSPTAMDIEHPLLNAKPWNIHSVVVEDVGQLTEVGDDGEWSVEIKFKQHREAKRSVGKPKGSKSTPKQTTAQSEADKAIQDLIKQVKELSA
jgi:hypothetical protein